ncbi:4-hydroxy-tetrahydrodipicolinate reductase [Clostridium sp. 19966]|uniref:4-hydroxy-tetrahydrodipicolinate reductase n=1 Tax=Clostridium sp. 19966 TaxID=2768166 RepID=UPI0028DFB6AB|nr:4-hydroxy-tetrahydrodipicolinate reductase [Clostridium sp. 19966]MDT8716535.1 4-hydroxy-tetrahydrodipicolinate reductase [Clostridium sp. 19966]
MINIILNGCNGRMGKAVSDTIKTYENMKIAVGIDRFPGENGYVILDNINDFNGEADVILDFSNVSSLSKLIAFAKGKNLPLVLCTTGYSSEDLKLIEESSKEIAIFRSANMSIGINILNSLLKKVSPLLYGDFDIEIIEKHHNQKLDAPSGTALLLADTIRDSLDETTNYVNGRSGMKKREKNDIGIHAVRGGSIVGEHEVLFAGKGETIELTHTALSREVFAVGALKACEFMKDKITGLYSMDDVIKL